MVKSQVKDRFWIWQQTNGSGLVYYGADYGVERMSSTSGKKKGQHADLMLLITPFLPVQPPASLAILQPVPINWTTNPIGAAHDVPPSSRLPHFSILFIGCPVRQMEPVVSAPPWGSSSSFE
ncbi:hypothetical protein KUCAC02_002520 [Chaenocephalus aceratus]|uniref:Uncharacterized protein n=1 Tax=Chaenocephalus aceratus TaxID=36190 RepID=A0ACB9XUK3_CHAAC|nr:hypothetical protein KUCAC02_002520 [Chaenocephalus aceratus]